VSVGPEGWVGYVWDGLGIWEVWRPADHLKLILKFPLSCDEQRYWLNPSLVLMLWLISVCSSGYQIVAR